MGNVMKEIFEGVRERLRTPQVLGLIVIVLLIFKRIFSIEFKRLILIFINGLGSFRFLINLFQLVAVMLFITSVIFFIASIFNTITYLVLNVVTSKKKNVS